MIRTITLNNIDGIPPFDVFVSDTNGYYPPVNIGPVLPGILYPLKLTLPEYLNDAPQILLTIVDSVGASSSGILTPPDPVPSGGDHPIPESGDGISCDFTIASISGTPPYHVYVSDINGYYPPVDLGPIPPGVVFPLTLTLPPYLVTAPQIKVVIVDAEDCETTTIIDTPGPVPIVPEYALLFIEPISKLTDIQNYLSFYGNTSFFGFGHGNPPLNGNEFARYMKMFASGGVPGLPAVQMRPIPQITDGFDEFGNPMNEFNFVTTKVDQGTVPERAWYTWVLPENLMSGHLQLSISHGNQNSPFIMTVALMNQTLSGIAFNYMGPQFANTTYRLYTTFPSTEFYVDNTGNDIYFRGHNVD